MSDLSAEELAAYQQRLHGPGALRTRRAAPPPTPAPRTIDPTAGQVRQALDVQSQPTSSSLTEDQIATLRSELGADIDLVEMQTRWQRLGDVRQVVLEVVRERLAAFQAGPAQFSLAGVYSQNTGQNIAALREQLQRVQAPGGVPEVKATRLRPRRSR